MINLNIPPPEPIQTRCIRILSHLIRQRNPTLTAGEARDRAIAAVMGALATREPQPQEYSHE